jgi:hypothetical protein
MKAKAERAGPEVWYACVVWYVCVCEREIEIIEKEKAKWPGASLRGLRGVGWGVGVCRRKG